MRKEVEIGFLIGYVMIFVGLFFPPTLTKSFSVCGLTIALIAIIHQLVMGDVKKKGCEDDI